MNIDERRKMSSNQAVTCDENITTRYNIALVKANFYVQLKLIKRVICQNFYLSMGCLSQRLLLD